MAGIFKNIANTFVKAAKDTKKAVVKAGKDTAAEAKRFAKSDVGKVVIAGAAVAVAVPAIAAAVPVVKKAVGMGGQKGTMLKPEPAKPAPVAHIEPSRIEPAVLVEESKPKDKMLNYNREGRDEQAAGAGSAALRAERAVGPAEKKEWWKQWWVWLIAVLLIVLAFIAARGGRRE